mgnify:CR=1 FL=1
MNERIRELAEQAGWIYVGNSRVPNMDKFSELLIKDCAQYIEDKFDFCGDELLIAEKLKEHFGVE